MWPAEPLQDMVQETGFGVTSKEAQAKVTAGRG